MQTVGRTSERWRSKSDHVLAPCQHAVESALQEGVEIELGKPVKTAHDLASLDISPELVSPDFPEVPAAAINKSDWKRLKACKWFIKEPIHLKEARGTLWGLDGRASKLKTLILADYSLVTL